MTIAAEKRFLTQDEVAKILRRSVQSVARLRRMGELAYLPGSPVLIPEAEVTAYLERKMVQRRAPPPPAATDPLREGRGHAGEAQARRQTGWVDRGRAKGRASTVKRVNL